MTPALNQESGRETIARSLNLGGVAHDRLDVVFVSLDVESGGFLPKEHACHRKLLEVGLSTLDTREIRDIVPGENGAAWVSKMRATHYLMSDSVGIESNRLDSRKRRLMAGDKFEFGNTTVIDRDGLADALANDLQILDPQAMEEGLYGDGDGKEPIYRRIIFVVQDWSQEERYLRESIGLDLDKLGTVMSVADAQPIHSRFGDKKPGLARLMAAYNCVSLHLHNGANDAVYTLVVLVLGTLWRHAWDSQLQGDWSFMNATFPLLRIRGEEAILALKEILAAEMSGRCEQCARYGHVEIDCTQEVAVSSHKDMVPIVASIDNVWIETAKKIQAHSGVRLVLRLRGQEESVIRYPWPDTHQHRSFHSQRA
ncbi:hypothetical protein BDV95DRAFT_617582 [Massariosphaeria phaeospora]|uniref:Gfd2/YDR514C-like C-terminal domain-containing protein n=1 Tax=Massariosphaeria phaeospora TaxID=100035 RepID=A0A7C8MBU5_9PLEO|nr:hypothetical protein BDV95DRAFT_617582 [Massariosphaeria phaeospora]